MKRKRNKNAKMEVAMGGGGEAGLRRAEKGSQIYKSGHRSMILSLALSQRCSPFFRPFWKSPLLSPFIAFFGEYRPLLAFFS